MAAVLDNLENAPLPHPSLQREPVLDVLRLIRSENVGPVTFFQLINRYGSAAKALQAIPELAARGGKRSIRICEASQAERELEAIEAFGAQCVLYGQPNYPHLLHYISDAPPLLMVRGNPTLWQKKKTIAIVGARNASANGCQFAYKLARELGDTGFVVTSGLARGIDASAHKGALQSGTVGVIANGIDQVYPPENKALYDDMAQSAAIITEQPFGAAPQARSFPARNRIISGMSLGTVVVEASFKSGSLITARVAADQGREVFAVPGSPMDARCKGTNDLIRQGATLTESVQDIMQHLPNNFAGMAEQHTTPFRIVNSVLDENELSRKRARVLEKLSPTPVLVDELIHQCQVTPNTMLTILLELELAGKLQRHPVNRVSLRIEEL